MSMPHGNVRKVGSATTLSLVAHCRLNLNVRPNVNHYTLHLDNGVFQGQDQYSGAWSLC